MADQRISYRLDLVVYIYDTTNGLVVEDDKIHFFRDGLRILPLDKGGGCYCLINEKREDFCLRIEAPGFHEYETLIHYEELDKRYPIVEAHLLPKARTIGYNNIIEIRGNVPGISNLRAVSVSKRVAIVGGYQERRKTLKLFNALDMDEKCYAIIHEDDEGNISFETFSIAKQNDRLSLVLEEPLKVPVRTEEIITRILHGQTNSDGSYLLCVRESGKDMTYIISYEINGEGRSKIIHFDKEPYTILLD